MLMAVVVIRAILEITAIGSALSTMTNFSQIATRSTNAAPTQAAEKNIIIFNPLHASATAKGPPLRLMTFPSATARIPNVWIR